MNFTPIRSLARRCLCLGALAMALGACAPPQGTTSTGDPTDPTPDDPPTPAAGPLASLAAPTLDRVTLVPFPGGDVALAGRLSRTAIWR
ncbi:hypothetical protein [Polyangium jinanense]|uniref:Uncharacterized protein n=1 Tax=Polyangium jinanense TaxID=2829994 RepID=A0A9X3XCB7_9BACT|nr:hypothetical protein [Polyangium jinanense]MDC3959781.1 hypothetical protein [Polyangium jinanense]MDC3988074.1 hypothetical protein [Polyangium jinanense]